jgi:hypothetical protein
MQGTMIYGDSLPFDKLLKRIEELQERFRNLPTQPPKSQHIAFF